MRKMVKESLQKSIPKTVTLELKKQCLTQGQLATMTHLSIPTIRQIERGLGRLSLYIASDQFRNKWKNLPSGQRIGERKKTLRKRKGLSQRKLASIIGVSPPSIIALETSEKGLLKTALLVLTVLGAGAYVIPHGEKQSFYTHAGNSCEHHGWNTPQELLHQLYQAVGIFDLDPCSSTANHRNAPVRARSYFTMKEKGLVLSWFGTVFVNPPYSRAIAEWIAKARYEVENDNAKMVIALVPARTDTKWWYQNIAGMADVFLIQGRLRFGKNNQSAPFPSALIIWGADTVTVHKLKASLQEAWYIPRTTD